jgi:putative transposase
LTGAYPYLYLDATYLKVNWGSHVGDLALLVVIGVNEQGFREVLAVESAAGEKKEAYRNLLKGLIERGLSGVQLVISDDHESIKAALQIELPSAKWQRCVVHFQRNVLCHVPASDTAEVASDLSGIFAVHREETARGLAEAFVARYGKRFGKAVSVLQGGLGNALTFLAFPTPAGRVPGIIACCGRRTGWSVSSERSSAGPGSWACSPASGARPTCAPPWFSERPRSGR